MRRVLLSIVAGLVGLLILSPSAAAQCTPDCRVIPEPAAEFYQLWLPAISHWLPLAPACSSDACPIVGLVFLRGFSMFQSLFVVADNLPDLYLWIGAGVLVVAAVALQFGRDTGIAVGGLLLTVGALALAWWLVAGWYAVDPRFVVGLGVGIAAGVALSFAAVVLWASCKISRGDNSPTI